MKKILLLSALAVSVATASAPAMAGELSAADQGDLTRMVQVLLGPHPTDGYYHGASVTHTVGTPPEGRSDCHVIKSVQNDAHGRVVGIAQRWACPHHD